MLTQVPLRFAAVFSAILIGGVFLGNMVLIYSSITVLAYLYLGFRLEQPSTVKIVKLHGDFEAEVDDLLTFSYMVSVPNGIGLVTVGCTVPNSFRLVTGNNFDAFWKSKDAIEKEVSFTVRCEKRGVYSLEEVHWETRHPLHFLGAIQGVEKDRTVITVHPKHHQIRRVRDRRVYSNMPIPTEAMILTGVPTTTFKEIRDYRIGDSYKSINWKATARRVSRPTQLPMVNEYEKEGRKSVWIMLNLASRMQLGTSTRNCFEYAVQAVLELSDFYLSRNCIVGLALFNDDQPPGGLGFLSSMKRVSLIGVGEQTPDHIDEPSTFNGVSRILAPDSGTKQFHKIERLMMEVSTLTLYSSLKQSIEQVRGYIQGSSPLFIIITMIDENYKTGLAEGILEARRFTVGRRNRAPVLVVHLVGYGLTPASQEAQRLRFIEDRMLLNELADVAGFVQWNPMSGLLSEAITSQVNG